MYARTLLFTLAALVLVNVQEAHGALLKGTVTGAPYVASPTTVAVPVTFSKQSAARAGLRAPVGVLVVPRRRSVPTPEGVALPSGLRLGDRFRFSASVPKAARAAAYTRLATSRLAITKRAKTLTNDELTLYLTQLAAYVGTLRERIEALPTTAAQLPDLKPLVTTIDTLQKLVADLISRTGGTAAAELAPQLAAVQQQVGGLLSGPLGGVTGTLTGLL